MRWLMRRVRGRNGEHGAVAALVAILLTSGVLVGMGALAVDSGQMYAARAQQQNGADAAALAIAQACAQNSAGCTTSTAARYATNNSNDGNSTIKAVCGRDAASPSALPDPTTCPAVASPRYCSTQPATGNFVQVHTTTRDKVQLVFGRALGGGPSDKQVGACAQATWGPPSLGDNFLALTISECEWYQYTNNNTVYAPAPPAVPAASYEHVLYFHSSATGGSPCPSEPPGSDLPGGFGSTQQTSSSSCTTQFSGSSYSADTGNSLSNACGSTLYDAWLNHPKVLLMPIYETVAGNGSNGMYALRTVAAFVVTGYRIPSDNRDSWLTHAPPCSPPNVCVSGYFIQTVVSGSTGGSGNSYGPTAVGIIG